MATPEYHRHPRTPSVTLLGLIRGQPPPAVEKEVFCVRYVRRPTWRATWSSSMMLLDDAGASASAFYLSQFGSFLVFLFESVCVFFLSVFEPFLF